jgi:hypothetical protein
MADNEPGLDGAIYRSEMQVIQARSFTKSERDTLMSLLTARVGDVFEEGDEPFFWSTRASNDRIDSYFTHMLPSSLQNYAKDADEGVQFQVSHNGSGSMFGGGGEVGFGRSLRGKFSGRTSGDPQTIIDFYTVPGLTCGNMTSDQFIKGARTGIYSDVSIGFMPGEFICDICGNDMLKRWTLDWDDPERCGHYLGMWYEIEGDKKGRKVQCTAGVDHARLNEVSVVYDGATPGAGILAVDIARMAVLTGELNLRDVEVLEQLYRVAIPRPSQIFVPGGTEGAMGKARGFATSDTTTDESKTPPGTEEVVQPTERGAADPAQTQNPSATRAQDDPQETVIAEDDDEEETEEEENERGDPMAALRAKYEGTAIRLGAETPIRTIEILADEVLRLRKDKKRLEKDAEDGRAFRESVLQELDASVVRAFGADGAEERKARHRRMVAGEGITEIRAMIADLEDTAKTRLGGGGRSTKEVLDDGTEREETNADKRRVRGRTEAHLVV